MEDNLHSNHFYLGEVIQQYSPPQMPSRAWNMENLMLFKRGT